MCVEECWYKSLVPLMKTVREQMGGMPVYLSFDIDGIDPAYCPGTGEGWSHARVGSGL